MPHQCTNCGRTFPDGSKEMLSGCPDCSGTKFQFQPDGFDDAESGAEGSSDGPESVGDGSPSSSTGTGGAGPGDGPADTPPDRSQRPGDAVTRTVGSAAATVRDLVGGSTGADATAARPPEESGAGRTPDDDSGGATDDSDGTTGAASDDDIIVAESDPVEAGEDAAQADARSGLADPDELPGRGGQGGPAAEDEDGGAEDGDGSSDEPASEASVDERASDVSARQTVVDPPADRSENGDGRVDTRAYEADDAAGGESSPPESGDDDRTAVAEPDSESADRPDLAELREELNEQFESIRVVEPGQYELNLMELYDREEYIIALQEDGRYSIQVPETWRDAEV